LNKRKRRKGGRKALDSISICWRGPWEDLAYKNGSHHGISLYCRVSFRRKKKEDAGASKKDDAKAPPKKEEKVRSSAVVPNEISAVPFSIVTE